MTTTEKNPGKYKALREQMRKLSGSYVSIGIFGGRAPDGASIAQYAAVHEFGSDTIPERSFIRGNDDERRTDYQKAIESGVYRIIRGTATVGDILWALGARVQADIKRRITAGIDPPLSAAYAAEKARRGWSPTPLIRFGTLRRAVTFAVTIAGKSGRPQ
jgi:hypothetical protein